MMVGLGGKDLGGAVRSGVTPGAVRSGAIPPPKTAPLHATTGGKTHIALLAASSYWRKMGFACCATCIAISLSVIRCFLSFLHAKKLYTLYFNLAPTFILSHHNYISNHLFINRVRSLIEWHLEKKIISGNKIHIYSLETFRGCLLIAKFVGLTVFSLFIQHFHILRGIVRG